MDRIDERIDRETSTPLLPPSKRAKSEKSPPNPTTRWWLNLSLMKKSSALKNDKEQVSELPSVDIIIPAYNAETTIDDALSSAYFQSYPGPMHLIVYDDRSSDTTTAKVREFMERNCTKIVAGAPTRKVTLLSNRNLGNGGAGFARDRCSNHGSGSVLVLLDSDDIMMHTRVEVQVSALMATSVPDKMIVGCRFYREPEGSTRHYTNWANSLTEERLYLEQYRELTILQPTWCLTRARFEELGGYGEGQLCVEGETQTELKLAEDLR